MGKRRKRLTMDKYAKKYVKLRAALFGKKEEVVEDLTEVVKKVKKVSPSALKEIVTNTEETTTEDTSKTEDVTTNTTTKTTTKKSTTRANKTPTATKKATTTRKKTTRKRTKK